MFARRLLTVAATLLVSACIDEPCDSSQQFINGVCVTVAVDARGGADAADGGVSVPFNAACSTDGDCGGVTNFCAVQPGQAVGFCTHTGCIEDPAVCPSGATCLDLTSFGAPGLSICYGGGA
jgi:hypothetical protein